MEKDEDPQWYRCEDCGIEKHISELTSGCPLCGLTMVPFEEDNPYAKRR